MAATSSFSFEDPPNIKRARRPGSDSVNDDEFVTAKGGVPDFMSFQKIDLAAISPAIGVMTEGQKYVPKSRGADYMFEEDERERGFGENVVFYAGSAYLTGFTSGTFLGVFEGLRKGKNLPQKLRVNAVVNACSKRGQAWGNNLGVMALMFTTFERLSLYARDKDDAMNAVVAAASTGAVFKSTSGLRACIAWSLIGGLGMGLITLSGHAATVLHRVKVDAFPINEEKKEQK